MCFPFSFIYLYCLLIGSLITALASIISSIHLAHFLINALQNKSPAVAKLQLGNKPPDVTHASVALICIFMRRNEFGFGTVSHKCLVHNSKRGFFFFFLNLKSILHTLEQQTCMDSATGCSSFLVMMHYRSTLYVLAPRLVQFYLVEPVTWPSFFPASKGPLSSLSAAERERAAPGLLWMCDRLHGRGVIPKGSRSNRVIYYTVQLFLLPPLPPPSSPSLFFQSHCFSLPLPLHQHFVRTNEE